MPKTLILVPGETLSTSLLKDSYTLLTNLILLGVSMHFNNTAWTVFAAILIFLFVIVWVGHKRSQTLTKCRTPMEAFTAVCRHFNISATVESRDEEI